MQSIRSLSHRAVGCLAALLALSALSAHAETISLRADNWFPYNGDPTDDKPGYVVEVLRSIFDKDGTTVIDYQTMPWKDAIESARKGEINGIIGAARTDAPDFIFPEEMIGKSQTILVTPMGKDFPYSCPESLKGKKLGVIEGYAYGEQLDEYVKANVGNAAALDESTGDTPDLMAIRKLQAGTIDCYASDRTVFFANAANLGFDKSMFTVIGKVNEPDAIYVALSPIKPESADISARLSAGIAELRASGKLAEILKKYGLTDWK